MADPERVISISADDISSSTFDQIMYVDNDFDLSTATPAAVAQRLQDLKDEYKDLERRQEQIRSEAAQIFEVWTPGSAVPRKKTRTRPLHDRLTISAGKQIMRAFCAQCSSDEAELRGIAAAKRLAKQHGVEHLSSEVLASVRRLVKQRYAGQVNGAGTHSHLETIAGRQHVENENVA